jgi:hypothetical protein
VLFEFCLPDQEPISSGLRATGTRREAATGGTKAIGLVHLMQVPIGLGPAMTDGNFLEAIGMAIAGGSTTIIVGIINAIETRTVTTIDTRLSPACARDMAELFVLSNANEPRREYSRRSSVQL